MSHSVWCFVQAIWVETSPGRVEAAAMVVIDMEAAAADMRLSTMYHRSPVHNLMFAHDGTLLHANRAALEAMQLSVTGACNLSQFIQILV